MIVKEDKLQIQIVQNVMELDLLEDMIRYFKFI